MCLFKIIYYIIRIYKKNIYIFISTAKWNINYIFLNIFL